MTIALATTLPQNTGSGYVAAAYIVFFAILLIYVAIMALRLTRVERRLRELQAPAEPAQPTAGSTAHEGTAGAARTGARTKPATTADLAQTAGELPHRDAPEQALEREPA
jgi:hypothetical protein